MSINEHLHLVVRPARQIVALCICLVLVICVVYGQVAGLPFFVFDAVDKVTGNQHISGGLTQQNISWAFTTVDGFNWHPLTWLSHMAVATLFGMSLHAHHMTKV